MPTALAPYLHLSSRQKAIMSVVRRPSAAGHGPLPGTTPCRKRPSKHTTRLVAGYTSQPRSARGPPSTWSVMRVGPPMNACMALLLLLPTLPQLRLPFPLAAAGAAAAPMLLVLPCLLLSMLSLCVLLERKTMHVMIGCRTPPWPSSSLSKCSWWPALRSRRGTTPTYH